MKEVIGHAQGFNPVRISGVRGPSSDSSETGRVSFNPVRISGVRGPSSDSSETGRVSFNPVRISGVRGPNRKQASLIRWMRFQSDADFWGPGTSSPT